MEKLQKKYGLFTGIAMVVGIVIGSGVFLKAGPVLKLSGGNLYVSLAAWLIGGLIMVTSGFCFAVFANRVKKYNGVVDYVELSSNKKIGYGLAWLITTLYYPTIASIVSVFASAYLIDLLGLSETILGGSIGSIYQLLGTWQVYLMGFGFVTLFAILNYFAPRIAGKFQVTATVVKLIPIFVIAVVGLFASLFVDGGGITKAFSEVGSTEDTILNFGDAVRTTAFAYEGWVCATIINAELKDSKKNLPRALVGGTIAIVIFYIIYYIGISASISFTQDGTNYTGNTAAMISGPNAPLIIFNNLLGVVGKKIFTVFILISCLGTTNGVTLATARGMYTMACRGLGPAPEKMRKLNEKTNMSFLSCLIGYLCTVFMVLLWYLANTGVGLFAYLANMDTIVCALIYGTYIIMFVYMIGHFNELNVFKRFVMPIIAIIGCSFFILVGTGLFQFIVNGSTQSLKEFAVWLILFFDVMTPCLFFYRKDAVSVIEEDIEEENK